MPPTRWLCSRFKCVRGLRVAGCKVWRASCHDVCLSRCRQMQSCRSLYAARGCWRAASKQLLTCACVMCTPQLMNKEANSLICYCRFVAIKAFDAIGYHSAGPSPARNVLAKASSIVHKALHISRCWPPPQILPPTDRLDDCGSISRKM